MPNQAAVPGTPAPTIAPPVTEAEVPRRAKKSGSKKILLLIIAVLLLGVTGLAAWKFGGKLFGASHPEEVEAAEEDADSTGAAEASDEGDAEPATPARVKPKEGTRAAKPPPVEALLVLEPFTVNLADSDGSRYMRLSIRLGIDSKKAQEKLVQDEIAMTRIRDSILGALTVLTTTEVLSVEGKSKLRQDLMTRANGVLPQGRVVDVYILDLVVQ